MKFSVIIPTFNRPESLGRCLAALSRLSYPRDEFEVIVVDDGGAHDLAGELAPYQDHLTCSLLRQANAGPSAARNKGALHAKGVFLAFIDDDCEPHAGWLQAFDAAFSKSPDVLAGGRVVNGVPDCAPAAASQLLIDYIHTRFNRDAENARFFPSNNIAVAAGLYRQIGGFDEAFRYAASEDRDLCDRWLSHGRRMVWVGQALVSHHRPMSPAGFWKQHFLYGGGAFSYALARRRRSAGPVPFEGWRFHAGLVLAPFRFTTGVSAIRLVSWLLLSQVAVIAGYCRAAARTVLQRNRSYNSTPLRSPKL